LYEESKKLTVTKKSKQLISAAILFFALSPLIVRYSPKLFYWLECRNGGGYSTVGWDICGGLGFQYMFYAWIAVIAWILIGCLFILFAIINFKKN
jgi:hypothetical protein